MTVNRRDNSPEDSLSSKIYKTAKSMSDNRKARALKSTKSASSTPDNPFKTFNNSDKDHVDNWSTSRWVYEFTTMLLDYEVNSSWFDIKTKKHRTNTWAKFLREGSASLGNKASVWAAVVNIIVSLEEEDFPFYTTTPENFHLGYVGKAWPSYKKAVEQSPRIALRCFQESDLLSRKMRSSLGNSDFTQWTSKKARADFSEIVFEQEDPLTKLKEKHDKEFN